MSGTVQIVTVGAATATLRELIWNLRGDDPLCPVTVIVPSALAGATLRRGLSPNGLAGVRFTSLPQYIDGVLTAAGRSARRRTGARRRALVAHALGGSRWAAEVYPTGTLRMFDALLAELDDADLPPGEDLGAGDVLAVYRRYRSLLPPEEHLLPADNAAALVPPLGEPVVLHLPRRLTAAELRFCRALGDRLHVILGFTGEPNADIDTRQLSEAFTGWLTRAATLVPAPRPSRIELSVDIDAEEEIRQAVRRTLEHLTDETHRADRVALAYRSAIPYARLCHEQLTAAGLPHHVPQQRTLAQTVAGGVLLGFLALPDSDFSRPDMALWWASAPLRSTSGARVTATRWDRLSREAGATRGRRVWTTRLGDALERAREAIDDADTEQAEYRRRRVDDLSALLAEMAELFDAHDALAAATTWTEASLRCRGVLTRHLGGPQHVGRWASQSSGRADTTVFAEQAAYQSVTRVVTALAALDGTQPYDGLTSFRQVLDAELARPVRESSGLGRGVLVAPLADLVGADLDLLLVVGMTEGSFPPRAREHPILRDEARDRSGGALRTTADRRRAERRDFLTVLATAPTVILSHPAADLRSQRATHPAPWFREQVGPTPSPMSFTERTATAATVLNSNEYDVQLLLRHGSPATADHPLAAALPQLAAGLDAVAARATLVFGPWTGRVGPLDDDGSAASASGLQTYATCPHSYFLGKVLGVQDRDEPDDEASPLDVGTVVHHALEDFFGRHLGRSPNRPWTDTDLTVARDILDSHAARLADEGKAGRPLVWATTTRRMRRSVRRTLLADTRRRRSRRASPEAVELTFGLQDAAQPAVEVELANGATVALRGSIDRVDVHEDGSLTVLDWKTGKRDAYDALAKEPLNLVDRGRHLQLPLYAEAALAWHGRPAAVNAYYVFVDHGADELGGAVDENQQARLHDALQTLTFGVAEGLFPMNPGDDGYFGWTHCGFCPFDRLCPSSRRIQWDAIREDPALSDYVALTEPTVKEDAQ